MSAKPVTVDGVRAKVAYIERHKTQKSGGVRLTVVDPRVVG